VIDRSGSMDYSDRQPLPGTPVTQRIATYNNNRLGAVYSALYGFWAARHGAINAQGGAGGAQRRDAYSVVLFDHQIVVALENDFTSNPDNLLDAVLQHGARGGTDYDIALTTTQAVMERHWSTERWDFSSIWTLSRSSTLLFRTPVVIFLSDGECGVTDERVQDLSRVAIAQG
jgi:hypothetical protein